MNKAELLKRLYDLQDLKYRDYRGTKAIFEIIESGTVTLLLLHINNSLQGLSSIGMGVFCHSEEMVLFMLLGFEILEHAVAILKKR